MADLYQKTLTRRGEPYRSALSVPNLLHHPDGYGVILADYALESGRFFIVRNGQHVELDDAGYAIGVFTAAEEIARGYTKAP